ncbi:MAG: tetratricopeptide repeat protein [Bacteroidales bacterium]|jgi:tetratricopeptide (TPR) repeat protein|nr:tetratricopeptide repeat protein [Bacteroidales bacterium]
MKKMILKKTCVLAFMLLMTSIAAFSQNAYNRLCLDAIAFEEQGKLDEATAKYSEAIRLKPDDWTAWSYRARVNLARGRFDDAIADATKAIDLSPQTLSLYAVRASCYEAKEMYDQAIAEYGKALGENPDKNRNNYLTYYQRGRANFLNTSYREAISDFDKAFSMSPKYWDSEPYIYIYRAQANLELGNYIEASADLDRFLELNPDDIQALLFQGYAGLKTNNRDKMTTSAQRILSLDPSKEVLFGGSNTSGLFDIVARREKAEKLAKDAADMITDNSSAVSKSLASMRLNDAFALLDTAWLTLPGLTRDDQTLRGKIREDLFTVYPLLKVKPETSEFVRRFMVQANSATQEKKYDDAIKLWGTSLNISPWIPLAYYNRALLYERKGQLRNSITDMEAYLALVPDASDARSARDKIYEWEGKIKESGVEVKEYNAGAINKMESGSYSPGNFVFAMAIGGSFGVQIMKNPDLSDLWTQSTNGSTPEYDYSDKMPFLYSGDIELVVKPIKRIGIGALGKITGGIGARTKVGGVKYMMDMTTIQYGGLLRYYLLLNNGAEKPDVYIQYAGGVSKLTGFYGIATMDGIIFDYSYMKNYDASDLFHSAGIGMGGKVGKKGYLTLSLDYFTSKFDKIDWEVSINKENTADVGSKGTLTHSSTGENITAAYNGILLKFIFGVCF